MVVLRYERWASGAVLNFTESDAAVRKFKVYGLRRVNHYRQVYFVPKPQYAILSETTRGDQATAAVLLFSQSLWLATTRDEGYSRIDDWYVVRIGYGADPEKVHEFLVMLAETGELDEWKCEVTDNDGYSVNAAEFFRLVLKTLSEEIKVEKPRILPALIETIEFLQVGGWF